MLFRIDEEPEKSISGTNDSKNSSDHQKYHESGLGYTFHNKFE